jgi:hypothetical protein
MSLEYRFDNRGTVQVHHTGSDKRSPCWYILASLLLLVLIVGGWLFFSGYLTPADSSGAPAMSVRGKLDEQDKLLKQQATTIKELEGKLTSVQREQQVQLAANDELSKKFAGAAADLSAAREKLALYEGILSPSGLDQGLHIQHFGIKKSLVDRDGKKADEKQGLYQYQLVLAQIKGGDTALEGTFSITITGKQDGKTVTVTQTDVTPSGDKPLSAFAVKHYQSIEGNLVFPKDFTPESVKLKVSPASGDVPDRLTKSYDWATFNDSNASTKKE